MKLPKNIPKNIPIIILLLITIVISFVIIRKIKNKKLVDDTQQLKIEEPEPETEDEEPEPETEDEEPEIEGFTGLENNSFVCEISQEDLMKGKFDYKTCGINQLVLDELNKIKNEN